MASNANHGRQICCQRWLVLHRREKVLATQQREPTSYRCEKCGHEGVAYWESEKGVDTSLTVHLFDTMDSWEVAYLLSGDADFIPCVTSLRRRGKIVVGAGFSSASSALIRECYDYVDLGALFIKEDVAAYNLFKKDGIIDQWLNRPVTHTNALAENGNQISFSFEWQDQSDANKRNRFRAQGDLNDEDRYIIYLTANGSPDLSTRIQSIEAFHKGFPESILNGNQVPGRYAFVIKPDTWAGVERRIDQYLSTLTFTSTYNAVYNGKGYTMTYEYKAEEDRYELALK